MARHPVHQLYDGGCELLAAAQSLGSAARRQECGQAIPATLGCIGATLDELATASAALVDELRRTCTRSDRPATATMQALQHLARTLTDARDTCEVARSRAAIAAADGVVPFP
jgi:hypothetical protein